MELRKLQKKFPELGVINSLYFYTIQNQFQIPQSKTERDFSKAIEELAEQPLNKLWEILDIDIPREINVVMPIFVEKNLNILLPLLLLQEVPSKTRVIYKIVSNGSDEETRNQIKNTINKIKRLSQSKYKFEVHYLNEPGRSNALQYARNLSKLSEILLFIDSDVFLSSRAIAYLYAFMQKYKYLAASGYKYPIYSSQTIISFADSIYVPGKLEHKIYGNLWAINNHQFPVFQNIYRDDFLVEKMTEYLGYQVGNISESYFCYTTCSTYRDFAKQQIRRRIGIDEIVQKFPFLSKYCIDNSRWARIGGLKGYLNLMMYLSLRQKIMLSTNLLLLLIINIFTPKYAFSNPCNKLESTLVINK